MALHAQMVITGTFVIVGKEPDGDSVRFIADDLTHYEKLQRGYKIKPSRDGSVQLRFEGVDAPELHYGAAAQPMGDTARDALLEKMGFSNIAFTGTKVTSADPADGVRGAILTKAAEANGRPVSYILLETDADGLEDGQIQTLDEALLTKTLNAWLLESGQAYYTVYTSTPFLDRNVFRGIAEDARRAGRGVWAQDTTSLFTLNTQEDIGPGGQLILPKLFRRSTDYLKDVNAGRFDGNLADWLIWKSQSPTRPEDDRVVIGGGTEVTLSALLDQRNDKVAFQADLLDIMFVEK